VVEPFIYTLDKLKSKPGKIISKTTILSPKMPLLDTLRTRSDGIFKVKNNNRTQVGNTKNARPKLDGHFY